MHHRIRPKAPQTFDQERPVTRIAFDEGCSFVHRPTMPLARVINHGHLMPCIQQLFDANTAGVSRSSCEENLHAACVSMLQYQRKPIVGWTTSLARLFPAIPPTRN